MTLEGRSALVTGGNRGIGLEVCRQLGQLGAYVMLAARDPRAGELAATGLREDGLDVELVELNVADADSVRRLAAHGDIEPDVVINNAGIYPRGADARRQPGLVELAWQTNFLGAVRVARAFIPAMVERGWGRIVNVSTGLAQRAHEDGSGGIYRATKIALNATSRAMAEELDGTGVLVNAISPGWCRTDMGGEGAPRSADQGAASIVWGVTLPDDGPTGGYFADGEPLEW
jgi:NAD(P)-dependent dehydrogenase (short-subunit alcohol dehydrogenase family)